MSNDYSDQPVRLPFVRITAVDSSSERASGLVVDKPLGAGVWVVRWYGGLQWDDAASILNALKQAERLVDVLKPESLVRVLGPADWVSIPSARAGTKAWKPTDKRLAALLGASRNRLLGGNTAKATISTVRDLVAQGRVLGWLPSSEDEHRLLGYAIMVNTVDVRWLVKPVSEQLLGKLLLPLDVPVVASKDAANVRWDDLPVWKRNVLSKEWRELRRYTKTQYQQPTKKVL